MLQPFISESRTYTSICVTVSTTDIPSHYGWEIWPLYNNAIGYILHNVCLCILKSTKALQKYVDQAMTSNLSIFEEIPQYVYWIYSP